MWLKMLVKKSDEIKKTSQNKLWMLEAKKSEGGGSNWPSSIEMIISVHTLRFIPFLLRNHWILSYVPWRCYIYLSLSKLIIRHHILMLPLDGRMCFCNVVNFFQQAILINLHNSTSMKVRDQVSTDLKLTVFAIIWCIFFLDFKRVLFMPKLCPRVSIVSQHIAPW